MGIGRIASFLSSLSASAAAESATPVESSDGVVIGGESSASSATAAEDRDRNRDSGNAADVTQQLQTMVSAVRQLNDNAVQQGAAVAVSPAGAQLKNAVTGLGHLLATIDSGAVTEGTTRQLHEAGKVMDSVEAGIVGAQAAAEQMARQMPAQQAQYALETSQRFQKDMRNALDQVRGTLSAFQR